MDPIPCVLGQPPLNILANLYNKKIVVFISERIELSPNLIWGPVRNNQPNRI